MTRILLTGATGLLGKSIIPNLLNRHDIDEIYAIVRAKNQDHLKKRKEKLLLGIQGNIDSKRIHFIKGDIALTNLGVSSKDKLFLENNIHSIFHAAASIRFDLPQKVAAQQNVNSCDAVLELAQILHSKKILKRLDYVSTAYVAGIRCGRVFEHQCDEGQKFRNTYEWSKCEAEKKVRFAISKGLPATIYRPSIIVGNSQDGNTSAFHALYWPVMLYVRGWWRTLPGNPDSLIDIVPVDYVVDSILKLQNMTASEGKCFHIASGDKAVKLNELVNLIERLTSGPSVRYTNPKIWRNYIHPLLIPFLILTKRGRIIRRVGEAFMPYFDSNPLFDTTNIDSLLKTSPPSILDYFEKILGFAISKNFRSEKN